MNPRRLEKWRRSFLQVGLSPGLPSVRLDITSMALPRSSGVTRPDLKLSGLALNGLHRLSVIIK